MKCNISPTSVVILLVWITTGLGSAFFTGVTLLGDEASRVEDTLEYNRDILPILAENCFACHGADSAAREADLRLDQRDAAIEYGALLPGEPEESGIFMRIMEEDPDYLMPPPDSGKHLTDEQKQMLKRWIADGAEYQRHWSLIAPSRSKLPAVNDSGWVRNAIDHFVLAKLESLGLQPAAPAEPRSLFRRLHLDITGLPPRPEDIRDFVNDHERCADEALSAWIDRLMEHPAWGEHRARYWLDAARYGDTHGLHFDNYREMWPYRDWVIRAFNANLPFDQFTVEQLAGDLLENPTQDQLIATGFQRCNITTNEGGTIDEENLANYAVDRVQTFGWVYLGLTTNCAQCHDHKFDPITMEDFYSLAAYFRNTTQGPKDGNVKDGRGPVLMVPSREDRPRWEALPGEIARAREQVAEHQQLARSSANDWARGLTAEQLSRQLPARDLLVHLPLDEASGRTCIAYLPERTAKEILPVEGAIQWLDQQQVRSAPVISAGRTFELGSLGDFARGDAFSYGAWVRPASKSISAAILARMDEQAQHRGWDLWQNGDRFSVHLIDQWPDNALKVTTQAATVTPGKWQHLLATYDGSGNPAGIKIYVDGREQPLRVDQQTLQQDADLRTSTPLRIGQRSQGAVWNGGAIQDVRIYERVLAAEEVHALANNDELESILEIAVEERSAEQQQTLVDYYLATQDQEYRELVAKVAALESEREAIQARSPVTHIQEEKPDSLPMAHILIRGEYDNLGEEVLAAPPKALHPLPENAPTNRLGLAQWVVDPSNPLTARVTVNRFWQQVFGRGLVATPEDFGIMGAEPTHPALLDWLAVEFQESGWDVKRFFKTMLMSATYRQAAIVTPEKLELDPENQYLSRGPRFRMDAEMVRDAALAASGLLCSKMYGESVKPYQPGNIWNMVGLPGGDTRNYVRSDGSDLYRRSLYTFWKRMAPPPNMEAFNAPSREVCTVRRERTNTPLQALVTLNDPQFVEAARVLAQRALLESPAEDQQVLEFITLRVLGRRMDEAERGILLDDHQAYCGYYQAHPKHAQDLLAVGEASVPDGLTPARLAAWTMVASQIMNLDEALNK